MTVNFVPLAERFWVSPQIAPSDLARAKELGVTLIINNRPDGEEAGQPKSAEVENAARKLGLSYAAIPIGGPVRPADIEAFDRAVDQSEGGVLAFCRTGTRSAILRAHARARAGDDVDSIIAEAADAGYNIEGQRPALLALSNG